MDQSDVQDPQVRFYESHALIKHKLSMMKSRDCPTHNFRDLVREISAFLCFEAAKDITLGTVEIAPQTGVAAHHPALDPRKVVVVPLLRGGLVVAEGALQAIPSAHVGHMGFYRPEDEAEVRPYLIVLPKPEKRDFILCDISIRTGGTMAAAIQTLLNVGASEERIMVLSVISGSEAIERLSEKFKGVRFHGATRLHGLNHADHNYPEFGDPDERLFGIIPPGADQ